ncbi:MAG: hypothetical protein GX345_00150 [Clostridiales bacterium]|nr:hypothetical protein [Clostridiales bacterium]
MEFIAAFAQYPWLSALFFSVCVLTAFVVYKAYKASQKSGKARRELLENLKRENKLKAQYGQLTQEKLEKAPAEDLLAGLALNLQDELEKAEAPEELYAKLPKVKRHIYAFYFLLEDSKEKLSRFFQISGPPLTVDAQEAVELILGGKAEELYKYECQAYDSDNEEVSFMKEEIDKADKEFAAILKNVDAYQAAAQYIRENAAVFLK